VEQRDRASGETRQPPRNRPRRVVGRRSQLQDGEPAADERDEVGEGAAGIGSDDDPPARQLAAAFASPLLWALESTLDSVLDSVFDSDFDSVLDSLLLLEVSESFAESLPPEFRPARA
jgi:hypothetical protein